MKLGKIFKILKQFWVLIVIFVAVLVLVIVKPFDLFVFGKANAMDSLVERVYNAMKFFGTDEKELFELLEPLSVDELEQVYKRFGNRRYEYGGRLSFLGSSMDLFGWFESELNGKEKARMRDIWAKTNIKITF